MKAGSLGWKNFPVVVCPAISELISCFQEYKTKLTHPRTFNKATFSRVISTSVVPSKSHLSNIISHWTSADLGLAPLLNTSQLIIREFHTLTNLVPCWLCAPNIHQVAVIYMALLAIYKSRTRQNIITAKACQMRARGEQRSSSVISKPRTKWSWSTDIHPHLSGSLPPFFKCG